MLSSARKKKMKEVDVPMKPIFYVVEDSEERGSRKNMLIMVTHTQTTSCKCKNYVAI